MSRELGTAPNCDIGGAAALAVPQLAGDQLTLLRPGSRPE